MKKFLFTLLFVVSALAAGAAVYPYLKLANTDGSWKSYDASGLELTFLDGNAVVTNDGTQSGTASLTELSYMEFSEDSGESSDTTTTVYGDVNLDKQVTVADVTAIYSLILGTSTDYQDTADVNGDEEVTVADVTAVYSIILGTQSNAPLKAPAEGTQTLNVVTGSVTWAFTSEQLEQMPFADGTALTVLGKTFDISEIDKIYVDDSSVADNTIGVTYNGSSAAVVVAGNIAQYITASVSNAHVAVTQSADVAEEITYTLQGSSDDGEFYMSGSYKATVELNGLTLTNVNPVNSGAAVHIQNGKRIKVKPITGTTNTLVDAASGAQKGCLYIKGHAEFAQKGTLNVTGNVKHAIKSGEYISIKNATINVLGAVGDGISCNEYFLMESGTVNISGTGDDGIQCDLDGTESTGETPDHEDEDSGNIYIINGTINANCGAIAAKGIKSYGDINISGGTITVTTTGNGTWDTDDLETKAASCISSDSNINISGGTLNLTSTGSGGKGMKCDGVLTVTDGTITVATSGGLYYNDGTTENTDYTGDTDRVSSDYYSSPKGIKAGVKTEVSTDNYTYSGGVVISGGTINVTTGGTNGEGIESKNYLNISGGQITVDAHDDAINSAQDLTISGGYVFARASNNDGIDANGNCYIQGGVVYAIGAGSPEVAIDANTEDQKKLYVQGGTLIAVGSLENGASITGGTCKYTTSWTENAWYALYNGGTLELAFMTPTKPTSGQGGGGFGPGGGGFNNNNVKLVVYTSSTPTLKSGISVSGGTEYFGGWANIGGTVSGGSSVSLTNYSSGGGGSGF